MMIYGDTEITWSQMHRRAAQVAQALVAEGVSAGDRIAFIDKNGPEFFEVLFGAGMINAVTVAVNWRLAPPEVEYTVNDAEARVLFVGPEFVRITDEIEGALTTVKKIMVIGAHERHPVVRGLVGRPRRRRSRGPRPPPTTSPSSSTPRVPPACPRAP